MSVIPHEIRGKRDDYRKQQEHQVDPEQLAIHVPDEMELQMVAHPEHCQHDNADRVHDEAVLEHRKMVDEGFAGFEAQVHQRLDVELCRSSRECSTEHRWCHLKPGRERSMIAQA
jgi:hypothetical protein